MILFRNIFNGISVKYWTNKRAEYRVRQNLRILDPNIKVVCKRIRIFLITLILIIPPFYVIISLAINRICTIKILYGKNLLLLQIPVYPTFLESLHLFLKRITWNLHIKLKRFFKLHTLDMHKHIFNFNIMKGSAHYRIS